MRTLMISGSRGRSCAHIYKAFIITARCRCLWLCSKLRTPCFLYKHGQEFSIACTFSSFRCAALVLDNFSY
uniref:Uncharacterized protein n=1 Tax=Arundo donax TaxID=35708 RepID=A0A0A9CQG2_ARUDO